MEEAAIKKKKNLEKKAKTRAKNQEKKATQGKDATSAEATVPMASPAADEALTLLNTIEAMDALNKNDAGLEVLPVTLPPRPSFSTDGTNIHIYTNHFTIKMPTVERIWVHQLSVKADYERNAGRDKLGNQKKAKVKLTANKIRRVLRLMLDQNADLASSATDYASALVSTKELMAKNVATTREVNYYSEGQTPPTISDASAWPKKFTVTIQYVAELSMDTLRSYLAPNATQEAPQDIQRLLTAMNLLLSRRPNQNPNTVLIGKSRHFDMTTSERQDLQGGLVAYFGYERSVRTSLRGLLLQVNGASSAFYGLIPNKQTNESNNISYLIERMGKMNSGYQDSFRGTIDRFIRGLRVRAIHNDICYTVWGLAKVVDDENSKPTPTRISFQRDIRNAQKQVTGSITTTVWSYMQSISAPVTWSEDLVINVGNQDREVCIPAELLEVRGGDAYRRLLNSRQTQAMVTFASKSGAEVSRLIEQTGIAMFRGAGNPPPLDAPDKTFGIDVGETMLSLPARKLDNPILCYKSIEGGEKDISLLDNKMANWNMVKTKFLETGKPPHWTVVELSEWTGTVWCDPTELGNFLKELRIGLNNYCSKNGRRPTEMQLATEGKRLVAPLATRKQTLETFFTGLKDAGADVVFVVLQSKDAAFYETLKYVADVKCGIHTICTVRDEFWKRNQFTKKGLPTKQLKNDKTFITNLMLKCNIKMGGKNTAIALGKQPGLQRLLSETTMIMGADVTHMGQGSMRETPSIAAVVASEDKEFAQYPASIRCQTTRTEMIEELGEMVSERLAHWSTKHNGALPTQIIFYRDGVSEGEFSTVTQYELPQIQKAIAQAYNAAKTPPPKLLLICIVKRSAARFFPKNNVHNDGKGNLLPGIVIDRDVTHPRAYDWFMQSHFSLQGTAKPAHYVVLHDEIKAPPEVLHRAIYWQCYTYGRSTKAIAVHPAARLADRACNRARAYLREYLVAGDRWDNVFDRSTTAKGAWKSDAEIKLRDSMFYI